MKQRIHASSRSVLKTERWIGQEIVTHKRVRDQVRLGPGALGVALNPTPRLVEARHVVAKHVVGHHAPTVLLRVPVYNKGRSNIPLGSDFHLPPQD